MKANKKQRDGFILYKSHFEPLSKLSNEQLGRLFRAIYRWQIDGKAEPEQDIEMAFAFLINQFRIDNERYRERCNTNRDNALLRWMQTDANGCERIQADAKDADKDKDKENDKDVVIGEVTELTDSPITSRRKFVKPTPKEVREYCCEKNYPINPDAFCDYYESKGWLVGKSPMRDWKAAVRNWVRNENSSTTEKASPQPTGNLIGPNEIQKMMNENGQ